jgi:MFS family permease
MTTEQHNYRLETMLPAITIGLLTLALILAKTGRDALFFQGRGLLQLPMAYMMIGIASLPGAFLYVQAMKKWGARPARVGILILTATTLAAFVPFLTPGNYPVLLSLFIFVPTTFGILFANIWLLASDIFEKAPKSVAAHAFSRIGASSLAGGMVGGFLAKGLALHLDPKWLVFLGATMILIAVGVVIKTHQKFPAKTVPKKNGKKSNEVKIASAFSKNYSRTLLLISMTGALASLFIDFLFYASASSAGMGSKGNASFFANFYIMLNFGSLILQLFLAPKIQDWIGLRGGLLILPFALLGGATFVTAVATALSRSVLRVTEGGLKASIHRSVWEQAFIPVESEERSLVKVFVDGIGARIAEGIGATVLFLWLMRVHATDPSLLNTNWIAWTLLLTAVVWLLLTQNLRAKITQEVPLAEAEAAPIQPKEIECERFPDQCPCTTEWGKGIK